MGWERMKGERDSGSYVKNICGWRSGSKVWMGEDGMIGRKHRETDKERWSEERHN